MKKYIKMIIFIFVVLLLVDIALYDYYTDEKHLVYVEYTVYTPGGMIKKFSRYHMRGKSFHIQCESKDSTDIFRIVKDDCWLCYGNRSSCLYIGTDDIVIDDMKIK